MPDLSKLSASKLNQLIAKRDTRSSAATNAAIAAGLGSWTLNDMRDALDSGAATPEMLDCITSSDAYHEAIAELDMRRRYHGGDQPIRRRA